jgi:hypothetical protein
VNTDLLEKLRALHRFDAAFCFPTDSSCLVWQLKTPSGVRLLHLDRDDISFPRACVLRSALEGYCWSRGVHLHLDLPPAGREGDPSDVTVTASRASLEIRGVHADVTMALLEVTLELLHQETR